MSNTPMTIASVSHRDGPIRSFPLVQPRRSLQLTAVTSSRPAILPTAPPHTHSAPALSNRLGYHIPPFNSVQHLHLHVLSLPLKSRWREFKYRDTSIHPSRESTIATSPSTPGKRCRCP